MECSKCRSSDTYLYVYFVPFKQPEYLCESCIECEKCGCWLRNGFLHLGGRTYKWFACARCMPTFPKDLISMERNWHEMVESGNGNAKDLNNLRDRIREYEKEMLK